MKNSILKKGMLALAGASAFAMAAPAAADDMTRQGFTFPENGEMKIVVFRPDVAVGSQKVSGLVEPNAEWTEAARANIQSVGEQDRVRLMLADATRLGHCPLSDHE